VDELEAKARNVVAKLNGWQPSPFDPVGHEYAVRDVAEALRFARAEALEEAAKVAEDPSPMAVSYSAGLIADIAKRIRALKDTE
jgi:hypothetical protein